MISDNEFRNRLNTAQMMASFVNDALTDFFISQIDYEGVGDIIKSDDELQVELGENLTEVLVGFRGKTYIIKVKELI